MKDANWPKNDIDYFILAELENRRLKPVGPASKRELIRRATFDLTGLPPTAEETEAFEMDNSPRAFEKVVDRLLKSPHYGERWGRYWLDVARYADDKALAHLCSQCYWDPRAHGRQEALRPPSRTRHCLGHGSVSPIAQSHRLGLPEAELYSSG